MTQTLDSNKVEFSESLMLKYCDILVADFFRILGVFEGREPSTKKIIYSKEQAYEHYHKYINSMFYEMSGASGNFHNNANFIKLLNILVGMKAITADEHHKLRPLVFNCISIIKKMREGIARGEIL